MVRWSGQAPRRSPPCPSTAPGRPGAGASASSREGGLDWHDLYERLARRPDRPDPAAREELERRVRAWAGLRVFELGRDLAEEVAAETCAEVWRSFNLSRGGAAFEGFVQGRFVEALRRRASPPVAVASEANDARLQTRLEELRTRNPRHHRAVELLYFDEATPVEAADTLAVDVWTLRSLIARARQALAQRLERTEQRQRPATGRPAAPRPKSKPRRAGPKPHRPGRRP